MTSITINEGSGIQRGELIKHLKNNNIDSRIVFPPISQYPSTPHEHGAQTKNYNYLNARPSIAGNQ
jgi:dTDP-4-amino-4,6-dideoxygalactose transaminase